MTLEELNTACEIVRDLANEHFGDWEQSCKFADTFRKAMTEKTNPLFEKCLANVDPDTRKEVRENMEYLQSKIDAHTKHMQEHGITSEQQLATLAEMRGMSEVPTNPWKKASDELPNEGEHILFVKFPVEGGAPYYETVYYPEPGITDGIDYWMPIPELPKED